MHQYRVVPRRHTPISALGPVMIPIFSKDGDPHPDTLEFATRRALGFARVRTRFATDGTISTSACDIWR